VVTGVAKLGVFCCIVVVGVTVFRGSSLRARMAEAWAMRKCPDVLQEDLDILLMQKNPKVKGCVGPPARAVCQVQTTEVFAPCNPKPGQRTIKKTAPLGAWDCTRRHVPKGQAGLIMKMILDSRANGSVNATFRRAAAASSAEDRRLIDELDSLASLLDARQTTVEATAAAQ